MSKYQQKSAKDKAFERERIKLHSTIQQKDEEIQRLSREVAKYRADAESWENTARLLESYIGIPVEQILEDIERNMKIANFLDPTISLIGRYLQR